MAEVTTLTLAVNSSQVRTATNDLSRFGQQGKKTEQEVRSLGQAFRGAQAAAGALAGSLVVREVIRAADTYALLNARLQLVSGTTQEFARAQAEVLRISQDTRVGLEQTAQLYTQLARSSRGLGLSQGELIGVTESINQALLVSGGNADSARAAITQLSQAFASGVLRGEEFNSVSEQAPRILQAIADGLGVNIGQLRKLAEAGELTAIRVVRAIQSQAENLKREAANIPLTVGQATQQAANSFVVLIGAIDETTGATAGLAGGISEVSSFLVELAKNIQNATRGRDDVGFLAEAFLVVSQTVRILLADVKFVFAGIGREIGAVAAQLAALGRLDIDGFRAISEAVREDAARARAELDRYQRQVLNPILDAQARLRSSLPDAQQESEAERRRLGLSNLPGSGSTATITTPGLDTLAGLQARVKQLKELREQATVGGAEFKRLTGEINRFERQIGSLLGRQVRGPREVVSEAQKYIESLRAQLEATENLSVTDQLLRDIQLGRLGNVTAAQREELTVLAQRIDLAEQQKQQETERVEILNRVRQAAIDEFEAIQQANDEYQSLVESLIDATPTKQLERQRDVAKILADEYERGRFGIVGSAEAIALFGETVNEFLGNTEDKAKDTKDIAEELGLTFSSAFEDAIVKGAELSEVLQGIAQDILRITTRELITEPIGKAVSDLVKGIDLGSIFGRGGSGGGGNFLSSIGSFVGSIFSPRAIGGPVSRGGLYEVNERGPELLNLGGRQLLMMGNNQGTVQPNSQVGGGGQMVNITVNVPIGAPKDRATALQFGRDISRQLSLAQSRNG